MPQQIDLTLENIQNGLEIFSVRYPDQIYIIDKVNKTSQTANLIKKDNISTIHEAYQYPRLLGDSINRWVFNRRSGHPHTDIFSLTIK